MDHESTETVPERSKSGSIFGSSKNTKFLSKIFNRFNSDSALYHYKLRTLCNKLSYVDYTSTLQHEFVGDKYPLLLQKYQSAIAATT